VQTNNFFQVLQKKTATWPADEQLNWTVNVRATPPEDKHTRMAQQQTPCIIGGGPRDILLLLLLHGHHDSWLQANLLVASPKQTNKQATREWNLALVSKISFLKKKNSSTFENESMREKVGGAAIGVDLRERNKEWD